jgi:hypothetical protein
MSRIRLPVAVLILLAALMLPGAGASAAAQSPVIADCNAHSQLTAHYTVAQLRTALNTMPPTVKEYTNCYDVINRALLAQIGSGSGGGSAGKGSGGSFLPVWLIVVLVLLILGGGGYAFLAYRRQANDGGPGAGPDAGPGVGPGSGSPASE